MPETRRMPVTEQKAFTGWAYIAQADDVPNCWVAHCLDFNILSIGDSPNHALEMVREAVGIALADDLNNGRDPHARKAEAEDWAPLLRLFEKHTKVPIGQMNDQAAAFKEFAAPMTLVFTRQLPDGLTPNVQLDPHGGDTLLAA